MSKLVAYFSYSGVTGRKAQALAGEVGADTFEIKAKVPYTAADVNWQDKDSRNVKEQNDPACRPEIESMPDLTAVDEIWVGYPIWWYTHPRIIDTFFDQANLAEKKIHLFATSGGSGIDGSVKDLRKAYPDLEIIDGERM